MTLVVDCPTCGAKVTWGPEARFRPFCSERCKLADLGAWANEAYRVAASPQEEADSLTDDDEDGNLTH